MSGMFIQTVTVYHRTEGPEGEYWARFVLEDVNFTGQTGKRLRRTGATADDEALLLIPFEGHGGYRASDEWDGEGWTIAPGDRLLKGRHTLELARSSSELRALGAVHTVSSVGSRPFGGLAHWEVRCDGTQN